MASVKHWVLQGGPSSYGAGRAILWFGSGSVGRVGISDCCHFVAHDTERSNKIHLNTAQFTPWNWTYIQLTGVSRAGTEMYWPLSWEKVRIVSEELQRFEGPKRKSLWDPSQSQVKGGFTCRGFTSSPNGSAVNWQWSTGSSFSVLPL